MVDFLTAKGAKEREDRKGKKRFGFEKFRDLRG